MKFNRDVQRLLKTEVANDRAIQRINTKVQEVCDFELHLQNMPGDGWCFMSDVSGFPLNMKMEDVLEIVEKTGKLTIDDWNPFN